MKQSKQLRTIAGAVLVLSTITVPAYAYMKHRVSNTTFSVDTALAKRFSERRHETPALTKASYVQRSSEEEAPTLRGLVVSGQTPYICEFKAEKGLSVSNIFSDPYMEEASGGAFYADGKFYVMTIDQPYAGAFETLMTIYDAQTWDIVEEREGLMPSSSGYCMTYDSQTGSVYGYFMNDDVDQTWQMFGRMNLATGEVLGLNNVDAKEGFRAIAAGTDGYLYGVNETGMYCRITKQGEVTKLGHTDIKPAYVQSAVIDPVSGKFYWAGFTDEGQGGLYVVDPVTYMATLIEAFPNNQEIVGLYVVDNTTSAEMPAEVLDLKAEFIRDTMEGTVSFTAPDVYGDGKSLSGSLTAHVAVDGKHYEKNITPGASVSFDVAVSYGGLYNVAAWVSTSSVSGNKSYVQRWVGADNPCGVRNLSISSEGSKVNLSWEAPTAGQHGGYVNPEEMTYIISRDGYGSHIVRDYVSTSFIDEFEQDIVADVRYSVRSVYKDLGGPILYSDRVHVGPDLMEVPISLSAGSDFKKFTVIDANEDDNTWTPYIGYATYTAGSEQADDWMITPQIRLDAGTLYELSYSVSAKMGIMSPENIEVMIGSGDTAEAMTDMIDSQTIKSYGINKFNTYTANFSVENSGTYRLGFHAVSNKGQQMGLSSIELTKLASSVAPAAPTSLMVTAAPQGKLSATVTFTLPDKDSEGKLLTGLSKVEMYDGDRLAATSSDILPGGECSLIDNNAEQGERRYTVIVYGADGTKGVSAVASGWIGIDIPSTPTAFEICEIENGVHASWQLPETGIHGGYVNPDEVTYLIVEPTFQTLIGSVTGGQETDITFEPLKAQTTLSLGLMVKNSAGANPDGIVGETIKIGPAYQLPIHEHFGHNTDYSWSVIGGAGDDLTGWMPEEETLGMDGFLGVTSYYGEYTMDAQKLASGKIHIPESGNVTLRLWLMGRGYSENGGTFNILVSDSYGRGYTPIFSRVFTSDGDDSWQPVEVSMTQFAGKTIYLALEGVPAADGGLFVGVDNLSIRKDIDNDGAIVNISADTDEVEVGRRSATVKTWVSNQGIKAMTEGSYTVDFYAGERKFVSLPGKNIEASFGIMEYTAQYTPTTDDNDPVSIVARLNYADDDDLTNNASIPVSLYVVSPDLPSATGLQATEENEGVTLSWQPADLSEKPIRTITDDFESYRTFDVNRAGKWTIIDEDKSVGAAVSYVFPGAEKSIGWIVMEPGSIPTVEGGTLASRLPAYSGEKYMAAYRPSSGNNMDWLITPELSGNAQEVSFMARAESVDQGREMFEVYYSTGGVELSAFKRLDETSYRTEPGGWNKFSFKLPMGAKYFAVRCVSHNRLAMHIDDFSYESAATPLDAEFIGYNLYRDGTLINDVPTMSLTYLDSEATQGDHSYVVRTVYDRGEAPASNIATISVSKILPIVTDIDPALTPVYDVNGIRVNTMVEGKIYVTHGRRFIFSKH